MCVFPPLRAVFQFADGNYAHRLSADDDYRHTQTDAVAPDRDCPDFAWGR